MLTISRHDAKRNASSFIVRILDRYIARQIIISTLLAVGVLSVVVVLGRIFQQLLDKLVEGHMSAGDIVKFIGYTFPWSLSYTVPWGVLTAVLLTFGRLSADNELISMRMSGLSLLRITMPVFVVAGVLSGLCFWINTSIAPASYGELRRTTREAALRDPDALFTPGRIIDEIPGYVIYAEKRDPATGVLGNVHFFQLDGSKPPRPSQIIVSSEARITTKNAMQNREIRVDFPGDNLAVTRPALASSEQIRAMTPEEKAAYQIDIADAQHVQNRNSSLVISLKEFFEQSAKLKVESMSMQDLRKGLDNPAALVQEGHVLPAKPDKFRSHMLTEYNRRISFSLACLVLALVAVPFGITAQRRETSVGFVLSLVVGISYFAIIMLGELWKDSPSKMPHLWVWLPNVIFGGFGLYMFLRLQRR